VRGLLSPLIKLGIFLVVTAFATYVLGATIANTSYGSTKSYKAIFTDVAGLSLGDDVRIAGVRVGSIKGIKILKHDLAQVTFTVVKDRPLPKSTQAHLRYRNLVGQRYLDISQGPGDPNDILKKGGTIPQSQTFNALDLTALFQGFQPLFKGLDADQLNSLSAEIIHTLQGEGGSLELLLTNLGDLTNSIADKDQVIGSVVDNLTSVLKTVGDRDDELSNLLLQLQEFISGLSGDRKAIGSSIEHINALATSTTDLLSHVRAPLAKDITDLSALTANLNTNSATIQEVLQQLPPTVAALVRTGSYGSWFNFYLCSVSGTITFPGKVVLHVPVTHSPVARCQG
jgi:phospholipid/cholesterol/gamma-HCH transport system substrate-binding protein